MTSQDSALKCITLTMSNGSRCQNSFWRIMPRISLDSLNQILNKYAQQPYFYSRILDQSIEKVKRKMILNGLNIKTIFSRKFLEMIEWKSTNLSLIKITLIGLKHSLMIHSLKSYGLSLLLTVKRVCISVNKKNQNSKIANWRRLNRLRSKMIQRKRSKTELDKKSYLISRDHWDILPITFNQKDSKFQIFGKINIQP